MIFENMYTYGIDDGPGMKVIDVFVCKLRKKLTDIHPDAAKFVETIWGRGYRLPAQSQMSQSQGKAA